MFEFFHSIFAPQPRPAGRLESAVVAEAVERVIDGTDPRLRAVAHYQRILWRPVERALDYVADHADIFAPAICFDRRRFSADPRLRAMFVGPHHVLEVLSTSPDVRGYLKKNRGPTPNELFAALRVERSEKTVLGMALEGERVMRDVPQTLVNFHNHRVAFPAATEADTLLQVQSRSFDYLVEVAKTHLEGLRARREELERLHRHLRQGSGKAGAAHRGRDGWRIATTIVPSPTDPADQRRLQAIEVDLERLRRVAGTLSDQLKLVANIVGEPRQHLRFERVSMTLDHMNAKVESPARKGGDQMTFNELLVAGQRRITLELIRFPASELLPPNDLVGRAELALQRPGEVVGH